jgi:Lon protease-like protein
VSAESGGPALEEIALFPLRTVLFPDGPLELRIFEPRYLDMIRTTLRNDREFGVLLIRAGNEVGPADTVDVGTSARIADFRQLPEGLLGITCRGGRRFRLASRRRQRDGLYLGMVRWLNEPASLALPAQFAAMAHTLESLLSEIDAFYPRLERKLGDADWVGRRLAEILPIAPADKQYCLELDDATERLTFLQPFSAAVQMQTRGRGA